MNLTPRRLVKKWEEERKQKMFARMRREYARTLNPAPLESSPSAGVAEPGVEAQQAQPRPFAKEILDQITPKVAAPKQARVGRAINSEMLVWMAKNQIKQCKKSLEDWRWLDEPIHGELRGLPTTRGRAMMTNGVLVWIELTGDRGVFLGHWDNWISDLIEDEESLVRKEKKKQVNQQKLQEAERLLNLLLA